MTDRKPTNGAYYWIRPAAGVDWEPAQYMDGAFQLIGSSEPAPAAEVGPEIVPPA